MRWFHARLLAGLLVLLLTACTQPPPATLTTTATAIATVTDGATQPTATATTLVAATRQATPTPLPATATTAATTPVVTATPTGAAYPPPDAAPPSATPAGYPLPLPTATVPPATGGTATTEANLPPPPPITACTDAAALAHIVLAEPSPSQPPYTYDVVLRNTGNCTWTADYRLAHSEGLAPQQSGVPPAQPVAPGLDGRFRIAFAPTELGAARSVWQLRDPAGNPVGAPVVVEFGVDADGPNKCGLETCPTATPVLPPLQPATLQIDAFELVDVVARADGGRDVTVRWETSGASGVTLVAGTQQRFPQAVEGPADGTQTLGLVETYYPDPLLTLVARDAAGNSVSRSLPLTWPCRHAYFFAPAGAPATCPATGPVSSLAAEQTFQNGIMIWVEQLDEIYVILWDGRFWRFTDTWDESQPETDPSIVPPEGLMQPIRGFGKVWREHPEVRDAIGWPPGVELGYTGRYQRPFIEAPPEQFYLEGFDGQVYKLIGSDAGNWERVE